MLDLSHCTPGRDRVPLEGQLCPLGISEQDQLLATVGRMTSQAQSYRAHQDSGDPTLCLSDTSSSSFAVGHGSRTSPPLGPQQRSRPEAGGNIQVWQLLPMHSMPGSSCSPS